MTPSNTPHRLAREATAAELALRKALRLARAVLVPLRIARQLNPYGLLGEYGDKAADAIAAIDEAEALALPQLEEQQRWMPISSAPKVKRILAVVDGAVRVVAWTKTSHVPIYGWCLVDQGIEECDLCEPTLWQEMPLPPTQDTTTQEKPNDQ